MDTTQLQEYIKKAFTTGATIDQIKQTLLSAGWQLPVVETILAQYQQQNASAPHSSSSPTTPSNTNSNNQQTPIQTPLPKQRIALKIKMALAMLGIGAILIATYMFLMSVGKPIYHSPKTPFSRKEINFEQLFGLTTKDNPYRIYLGVRYTVKGKPFESNAKLFDYNVTITGSQQNQIITTSGTHIYSKSSSDSDKTTLSIQKQFIYIPLKDFEVLKSDTAKLALIISVPDSLNSRFTLDDWDIEVKGKVLKPPAALLIFGIILVVIAFLILFLFGRTKKGDPNTKK